MFAKQVSWPLALFAVNLLTACLPFAATTPTPTPLAATIVLPVQITPALQPLTPVMNECARQIEGLGIAVNERPASALDAKMPGIILRWGPPAEMTGYAAVIGSEELALVVHPSSPLESLTVGQLRELYSGKVRTWAAYLPTKCKDCPPDPAKVPLAGKEIHAWAYSPGDDIQEIFETAARRTIKTGSTFVAPDAEAMRQAVSEDPAAIGFLPARALDSSVKQITWAVPADGTAQQPGATVPADLVRQPILALTSAEPLGLDRQFLGCLQEKLK